MISIRRWVCAWTLVALLATGTPACTTGGSGAPSPPTAWESILHRIQADGTFDKGTALAAFALAVGPLPGVQTPPGPSGDISSGTLAVDAVLAHHDELTGAQQQAVAGYLAAIEKSATSVALPSPRADGCPTFARTQDRTLKMVNDEVTNACAWIAGNLGMPLTPQVRTGVGFIPKLNGERVNGLTNYSGRQAGSPATCYLTFMPDLARRGRELPETVAHEVFHCFQAQIIGVLPKLYGVAAWIGEGQAEWVGATYATSATTVFQGSGHTAARTRWPEYLGHPEISLFNRIYDAIGFYAHLRDNGVDVWHVLPPMLQVWTGTGAPAEHDHAALTAALGVAGEAVLFSWASSYLRQPTRGDNWDITGPDITNDSAETTLSVSNGTSAVVTASPDANELADLTLHSDVTTFYVALERSWYGRLGQATTSQMGDYLLPSLNGRTFCTREGAQCRCPDDSPGRATSFEPLDRHDYLAVSGLDSQRDGTVAMVTVSGQSLDGFCKKKSPAPPTCEAVSVSRQPAARSAVAEGETCGPGGDTGGGACLGGTCGSTNGDPHITTLDQDYYDLQAAGEFVAIRSGTGDLVIQTRQVPFPDASDVTVNQALAFGVAGDRVGLYNGDAGIAVHVDGKPVSLGVGDHALPRGGRLTRSRSELGDVYLISWPDGSGASVGQVGRWGLKMDVQLNSARRNHVAGLLGNFNGRLDDDLVTRSGVPVPPAPSFDQLYRVFAESWRITQGESLFDYAPGQSTSTFTNRGIPSRQVSAGDVPDHDTAEATCREAGVSADGLLQDCILDVGLTHHQEFARSAAEIQASVFGPTHGLGPGQATQDLTFSGPVAGRLRSAATQCGSLSSAGQFRAAITGNVGGQSVDLSIGFLDGYRGPGGYPATDSLGGGAELVMTVEGGSYSGGTGPDAGTVTVAPDGKSGTVDAELSGGEHVRGSWACDHVEVS